jgi:hypothetical protein
MIEYVITSAMIVMLALLVIVGVNALGMFVVAIVLMLEKIVGNRKKP